MNVNGLLLPVERGQFREHGTKITVVGVGSVGTAAAFAIMTKVSVFISFHWQAVANTVVLYDIDENKCNGEVMDMEQGSQFLDACNVIGGKGKFDENFEK